jgi:hypothetical protein
MHELHVPMKTDMVILQISFYIKRVLSTMKKKSGEKILVASMGRRPGLSVNATNIALRLLEAGLHAADVAFQFGCHERTIHRMQARFRQTESVNHRPHLGRPLKTTPREDRYLVTSSRRYCFTTAPNLV